MDKELKPIDPKALHTIDMQVLMFMDDLPTMYTITLDREFVAQGLVTNESAPALAYLANRGDDQNLRVVCSGVELRSHPEDADALDAFFEEHGAKLGIWV